MAAVLLVHSLRGFVAVRNEFFYLLSCLLSYCSVYVLLDHLSYYVCFVSQIPLKSVLME